jgi:glycyl-tRNA synthetase
MRETERLSELAKRRGFFFQSSEAYGGVSGFYTFGPEGAEVKRNVENQWRKWFSRREGHREIDAPTVMPEPVFEASGHLDTFDDMIVVCPECEASHRADHLVEDNTDIDEAEAIANERIGEIIEENDIVCPSCGTALAGQPVDDFNLMFGTQIGPGDSQQGFLRPETAQGIFVEFPRLKEYARNQLPFGITQIGRAYRNEISPRNSLVRTREFTQAELEHFIDPEEDEPELEKVEDVELLLYPRENQGDGELIEATVEEAVNEGIIADPWIAYYLALAKQWYRKIGVDMDRFRFRQHQEDELSHYSTDCWDAEGEVDGNWIELAGFSYRGCYDLSKHDEYSREDFTLFKEFDEPEVVEEPQVSPDMGYLGPEYGDKAGKIKQALQDLAEEDVEAFDSDEVIVEVEGEEFEIPVEKTGFSVEKEERHGEHILPHVMEPSFGVDRAVFTVLAHSLDQDEVDGEERDVLRLENEVAPTEVAVLPLMDKDGLPEKAKEIASKLRKAGFSVKYDESGNIGRRYRRQDEVGTPYCVTVDYETLEEDPETVTVRDRDTTDQERVETGELIEHLS